MTVEYDADAGRLVGLAVDGETPEDDRGYTLVADGHVVYNDGVPISREATVDSFGLQFEVPAEYAREEGIDVRLEGRLRER